MLVFPIALFGKLNIHLPVDHSCIVNPHLNEKDKTPKIAKFVDLDPVTGRPVGLPLSHLSPSGLFLVHYALQGDNAVDPTDKNGNGVPDYIDSVAFYFDYAYQVEVIEMGYPSPVPDDGVGGEGEFANAFDVYIWEVGNGDDPNNHQSGSFDNGGVYGYTYVSSVIQHSSPFRSYSFCVIDNNFSSRDSVRFLGGQKSYPAYYTTGIEALKITAAHEFHHAIQGFMGIDPASSQTMPEMTSVSMEFRLFPESTDYLQYVNMLFNDFHIYPFGKNDSYVGYGHSIFAQYLHENFGDEPIRKMWQNIASGVRGYYALDNALKELNTSLTTEWSEFTKWIYYTGERTGLAGKSNRFSNAATLPEIKFSRDEKYSDPSFLYADHLSPFEILPLRVIFDGSDEFSAADTLSLLLTNTDISTAGGYGDQKKEIVFSLSKESLSGFKSLDILPYFYMLSTQDNNFASNFFEHLGSQTRSIDFAYPNPFDPSKESLLHVPVPEETPLYDRVHIVIYSDDMQVIETFDTKVGYNNEKRVATVSFGSEGLSSGVYIFKADNGESVKLGKFSVINNSRIIKR